MKVLKEIRRVRKVIAEARSLGTETVREGAQSAAEVLSEARMAVAEAEALGHDVLQAGRQLHGLLARLKAPEAERPTPIKVTVKQP